MVQLFLHMLPPNFEPEEKTSNCRMDMFKSKEDEEFGIRVKEGTDVSYHLLQLLHWEEFIPYFWVIGLSELKD